MSLVVTGATGQLGRLIVESLIQRGVAPADIVAAGRKVEALQELANRGVNTAVIDYSDPASLKAAFTGAETLVLVSGSEVGKRVAQHANAITAATDAGISRIVYTSAPHADDTTLILAPEHKATEELIIASGIPFTILRNGWYTENYLQTVEQAGQSGVIIASVGDARVASASRTDYAEAVAAVLTTPGHENAVYELSGDVAWTHDELADAAARIFGRDVVYTPLSADEHLAALTAVGLPDETAGFIVALDANIADGLLGHTPGDLSRLIGRPTTPLEDGLRDALGVPVGV
jgi:NAD(P)H dehydrogenase (quinone)